MAVAGGIGSRSAARGGHVALDAGARFLGQREPPFLPGRSGDLGLRKRAEVPWVLLYDGAIVHSNVKNDELSISINFCDEVFGKI